MLKNKFNVICITLYTTSFFTGLSIMIIELVASRIITPYTGNTIHTWTNIIGVILISLAIGYLIGGNLAGKNSKLSNVSILLMFSSIYLIGTAYLYYPILNYFFYQISDVRIQAFISGLLLFSFPSICLAAITPFIAKAILTDVNNTGIRIGLLYMISTIGSILGTYLTGYILILNYGSQTILIIVSLLLFGLSLLLQILFKKNTIVWVIFLIYIFVFIFLHLKQVRLSILVNDESQYQTIWIYDVKNKLGQKERYLTTDQFIIQGRSNLENPINLISNYANFFDLYLYFNPQTKRTLMIGGGAYSYPKYFISRYKDKEMDVIELDKKITEYAYKYFHLKENENLTIYHDDARHFINTNKKKYDVIFIDAFSSISIPYQLITKEAVTGYFNNLNMDGIVIVNIVSSLEGEASYVLKAQNRVFTSIFPQVMIIPTQETNSHEVQNIIIIASKNPNKLISSKDKRINNMLAKIYKAEIDMNIPIFTDDYAPLDHYLLPLFRKFK